MLSRLGANDFAINPLKCEWGVQETDWLGYWLTPLGLKPWREKIDAILKHSPPTTLKELRAFIGAVTFYRDMFPRQSHILDPFTKLTKGSPKKIIWTDHHQKAFDTMKAVMAQDVMVRYPAHNLPFHVYTDVQMLATFSSVPLLCKMVNLSPSTCVCLMLHSAITL